jgi:parvulin-like peptidyl-prolyl isomerase
MKPFLCSFLGLLCLMLQAQEPADMVLGRLGDEDVKADVVLPTLNQLTEEERAALMRDPAALTKLVRSLMIQRLVLREALEKKWDERPEVIDRIRQARDTAITDSYLRAVAQPPESYPNEAELKSAYESRRATLAMPQSFHLAQIFISDPKGQDKQAATAARTRLDKVRELVRAPECDFAAVARQHSEERESAARGGVIGWLTQLQIQPEIFAKLPELKFNDVSEALRLEDGWHFVKVLDARQPFVPTLDQVRADLVRTLRGERGRAGTQDYLSKKLQETPVVINELAVSKLLVLRPTSGAAVKP